MLKMMLPLVISIAACGDNKPGQLTSKDARGDDAPGDDARPACTPIRGSTIKMRRIGEVTGIAVLATSPPADPRLFIVVREGQIQIFASEKMLPEPFLDLSNVINAQDTVERGLLGLAFHPTYAANGRFFVYYTTGAHNVVARCSVSPTNPNRANPTCLPILEVLHDTAGNHNGGMIEFGNDGLLYIGTGDGGGAGDPFRHAQDPSQLLGKILRIDVDREAPGMNYGIPPTNPYADGGGRPEVFIRGLRNPWRWSFDRATGDLWIGDVGQNRSEELTVLRPSQQRGANLGWSIYEGVGCCATQDDRCLQVTSLPCDPTGMTFPQEVRDRRTPRGVGWASIIGGQTYRGTCYPDLVGYYFYTDTYRSTLVKARLLADDSLEITDIPNMGDQTSSLHADSRGELYITRTNGEIDHLEAGP
jgi:glucose/arabinose dehydrogenase